MSAQKMGKQVEDGEIWRMIVRQIVAPSGTTKSGGKVGTPRAADKRPARLKRKKWARACGGKKWEKSGTNMKGAKNGGDRGRGGGNIPRGRGIFVHPST
jgi:hypothetical protein